MTYRLQALLLSLNFADVHVLTQCQKPQEDTALPTVVVQHPQLSSIEQMLYKCAIK